MGSLGGFAAWRLMMEVLENQGGRREFIDLLEHLKRSYYFISSILVPHFPPFLKGQVFEKWQFLTNLLKILKFNKLTFEKILPFQFLQSCI